jgi:hypothetical protein
MTVCVSAGGRVGPLVRVLPLAAEGARDGPMWMQGPEEQKAAADRFARSVLPVIDDIRAGGITTLSGIAAELYNRGIETVRGGRWTARSVKNMLERVTR